VRQTPLMPLVMTSLSDALCPCRALYYFTICPRVPIVMCTLFSTPKRWAIWRCSYNSRSRSGSGCISHTRCASAPFCLCQPGIHESLRSNDPESLANHSRHVTGLSRSEIGVPSRMAPDFIACMHWQEARNFGVILGLHLTI
jgi:hypothetical protein